MTSLSSLTFFSTFYCLCWLLPSWLFLQDFFFLQDSSLPWFIPYTSFGHLYHIPSEALLTPYKPGIPKSLSSVSFSILTSWWAFTSSSSRCPFDISDVYRNRCTISFFFFSCLALPLETCLSFWRSILVNGTTIPNLHFAFFISHRGKRGLPRTSIFSQCPRSLVWFWKSSLLDCKSLQIDLPVFKLFLLPMGLPFIMCVYK